jgi:hypothetical protein
MHTAMLKPSSATIIALATLQKMGFKTRKTLTFVQNTRKYDL